MASAIFIGNLGVFDILLGNVAAILTSEFYDSEVIWSKEIISRINSENEIKSDELLNQVTISFSLQTMNSACILPEIKYL